MDLSEIKKRGRTGNQRDGLLITHADYAWLIAEVERLRQENETLYSHFKDECGECDIVAERDRYKSALAEGTAQGFICYLIDNCEGDCFLSEELLQQWYADFLKSKYAAEAVQPETCESCRNHLGDNAPLYEDADICRKCHNEIQAAEEGRG
jgi:hypothetical protein